jgi:acetyl-CoA C-acetyltransferase
MSHAPIQWNAAMVNWLSAVMGARSMGARIKAITAIRPAYLKPVITLLLGLSDPLVKLSMGQTAEIVAKRFGITREQMDTYALQSHQRLAAAFDAGDMSDEVVNLYDNNGNFYNEDTGMRRDSTLEKLAKLRPVFDRKYGNVTSGNSSQITDGAAMLLLASEKAVKKYDLQPIAELVDHEWAGVDPAQMGLGPVHAVAGLLQRNKMAMNDIDHMELNEAFAAQVLGCQAAWDSNDYAKNELGMKQKLGPMDEAKLNPQGGAISCGHPVGASGARIVLHLARALNRQGGGQGVATLCIGGGQGGAMLVRVGNGGDA